MYIFLGLRKIKEKQEFYYYSECGRVKIDYKAEGGDCRLSLDNIDSLDFFSAQSVLGSLDWGGRRKIVWACGRWILKPSLILFL